MKPTLVFFGVSIAVILLHNSTCNAELVFTPSSGDHSGEVRTTQTPLGEWVSIVVEFQASEPIDTMRNGFRTLDEAVFNRGSGELETSFLAPKSFSLGDVSTGTELSTQGWAVFAPGNFGPVDQLNPLARLVLSPGSTAEAFAPNSPEGGIELISNGTVIGTITGSVTAVPEPSAMAGLGLALLGWVGVRYRRRRRLALA